MGFKRSHSCSISRSSFLCGPRSSKGDRGFPLTRVRHGALKTQFRHLKQWTGLQGVRLRVGKASDFPAARNMAWCELLSEGRLRIVVAPKLARQSWHIRAGVLMHEFGHAAFMAQGNLNHSEHDADRMAAKLFGCPIRYTTGLDVQTVAAKYQGRSTRARRPRHLPR
jgi:hypothetical protein